MLHDRILNSRSRQIFHFPPDFRLLLGGRFLVLSVEGDRVVSVVDLRHPTHFEVISFHLRIDLLWDEVLLEGSNGLSVRLLKLLALFLGAGGIVVVAVGAGLHIIGGVLTVGLEFARVVMVKRVDQRLYLIFVLVSGASHNYRIVKLKIFNT